MSFKVDSTIEHACKRGISPSEHACIGVRTGEGLDALEHRHPKEKQTDAGGKSYQEIGKATERLEPTTNCSIVLSTCCKPLHNERLLRVQDRIIIYIYGFNGEYAFSFGDLGAWRPHWRTCEATRTPGSTTYETQAICLLT